MTAPDPQDGFRLVQLWNYPIKGLPGQRLTNAQLCAHAHFPGDRRYAIGAGHPAVADDQWLKKAYFLQLMSHEQLAAIRCDFDGDVVTLTHPEMPPLTADLATAEGRDKLAAHIEQLIPASTHSAKGNTTHGPIRVVSLENGAFTDTKAPLVSLGGTASLDGFANLTGTAPDPRRFRLNMIFETETPFEEAALIGKTIAMGTARLRVIEPVGRCAAIDVDPQTAIRGPHYLPLMRQKLGHSDLGIFAEVLTNGLVAEGDRITVLD